MAGVVHAREEHILGIDVFILVSDYEVRVLLVLRGLLLTAVDGCALLHSRAAHLSVVVERHLRGVGLTVEQRAVAILVTAEVRTEREDVLWRVLIHRRIGHRTDDDECIARVANHQHQHAEQCRILEAGGDEIHRLFVDHLLAVEQESCDGQHDDADDEGRPAVAVERNADEAEGEQERDVLAGLILVDVTLADSPYRCCNEAGDVDDEAGVERQSERIDEEQLKPATDGDDAGYDAVEHGGHDDIRDEQGNQRALQLDVGEAAVAVHQHDGGQTEQVEQVHADAQSGHVEDEYQPTVGVGLVGVVFPFQDEPEHDGREC